MSARCKPSTEGGGDDPDRLYTESAAVDRPAVAAAGGNGMGEGRHGMAHAGIIEGRPTVHRKNLLTRFSHLGEGNFHTGYAARAGQVLGTTAIRRQLRNHMAFIAERLR